MDIYWNRCTSPICGWWVYRKVIIPGDEFEFLDFNRGPLEERLRLKYQDPSSILNYWRIHDITKCDTNNVNGKKLNDGGSPDKNKKLVSYKIVHKYKFGDPMRNSAIIRVRMDKVKELIDVGEFNYADEPPIYQETYAERVDRKYNEFMEATKSNEQSEQSHNDLPVW
jgi:hypothetical protein